MNINRHIGKRKFIEVNKEGKTITEYKNSINQRKIVIRTTKKLFKKLDNQDSFDQKFRTNETFEINV